MNKPIVIPDITLPPEMEERASDASAFLKAISNETRLMLLCALIDGELSVGALEKHLNTRQATVSQHLARLKQDGLVQARRDGKTIYYSIADPYAVDVMRVLFDKFCGVKQ